MKRTWWIVKWDHKPRPYAFLSADTARKVIEHFGSNATMCSDDGELTIVDGIASVKTDENGTVPVYVTTL